MKPEHIAVAVVILATAAGFLLLWPDEDPAGDAAAVEALAGPQPEHRPPP
jgi:hypothetical protein